MNFKSKENTAGHQIMLFNIWGFNEIKHMDSFFFGFEKCIPSVFIFFLARLVLKMPKTHVIRDIHPFMRCLIALNIGLIWLSAELFVAFVCSVI